MTNSKNNERKSVVKGFKVSINNGELENKPFEIETEYTRTPEKARKFVAAILETDVNFIIVTEIINEKREAVKYNVEALLMDGFTPSYVELEKRDEFTIIKTNVFIYTADVFGYDADDNPFGDHYETTETAQSFTKVDARASVRMEYESIHDKTRVILVNNCAKHEFDVWLAIPDDVINEYIIKK